MIRAQRARGNDSNEIPLARRIGRISSGRSERLWRFLPYFLGFVFIGVIFLFTFLLDKNKNLMKSVELGGINNEKLLGHFPYPEANASDLRSLPNGMKVHKEAFDAVNEMIYQASLQNVQLIVISGFRSVKIQKEIFYHTKSSRNQIAIERAKVSAPPGYSEHSTGYAVDFGDRNRQETDFEVSFESTPAYKWLSKNAARYHFILSFPKGNKQGVSYEPWHWRYEGTVEALKKFESANQDRRK